LTYIPRLRSCKLLDAFVISSLPPMLSRKLQTAGPLRSTSVTRLHGYYGPIRHPLAFSPLPGFAGYRTYLAPAISRRGEEGFSSCLACPCHRAVASTPPKWIAVSVRFRLPMLPSPSRLRARPSELFIFEATSTFTFVTARRLAHSPRKCLSIGFKVLVSRHPAIQATGPLTPTPAGLTPAEHASLRWTHNRA
jgi:hypothetical protein